MTILVTGWTGNAGSLLLPRLRERFPYADMVGISRQPDAASPPGDTRFFAHVAGLDDSVAVEKIFADHAPIETVIHIAHIHYSPLIMSCAARYGTTRAILVHTTGIYSQFRAYGDRYRAIDTQIQAGAAPQIRWTILRPTMIYGNRRDRNMHKLIRTLARSPIFPMFGSGTMLLQPVHIDDVVGAILMCLENPATFNRAYDLSGGTVATYREVVALICRLLGKKPLVVPTPTALALCAATLLERVGKPVVTVEQIRRLGEDKAYPHNAARDEWGFAPRTLEEGLREEIAALRAEGLLRR